MALNTKFPTHPELQTIRQVLVWCRQEKILLPSLVQERGAAERIAWRLPVYPTVQHMLTKSRLCRRLRLRPQNRAGNDRERAQRVVRSMQRDRRSWEVLLCDRHEGYISWAEFEKESTADR